MKIRPFKLLRQFLAIILTTLTGLSPAYSIVVLTGIPAKETPVVLNGFKLQLKQYRDRYDGTAENNYQKANVKSFWFSFKNDAPQVLREIGLAQIAAGRPEALDKIVGEFRRLQADLISRGFEPSQNDYWAPAQELNISYNMEYPGPRASSDDGKISYTHSFEFEMRLNYQPKGHVLKNHETYPRIGLSGSVLFVCQKEFDDCIIINSEFSRVSISWEQIPGPRIGGNSSAGGGDRNSKLLDKAILSSIEIKGLEGLGKNTFPTQNSIPKDKITKPK